MPERSLYLVNQWTFFFSTSFTENPTSMLIKPEEAEETRELFGFQQTPPQQENRNFPTTTLGITVKIRSHVKAQSLTGEELTLLSGSGDVGLKW